MEALFTINYLTKIFPSYVKKNATEATCYNLFFHGKAFCPADFTRRILFLDLHSSLYIVQQCVKIIGTRHRNYESWVFKHLIILVLLRICWIFISKLYLALPPLQRSDTKFFNYLWFFDSPIFYPCSNEKLPKSLLDFIGLL